MPETHPAPDPMPIRLRLRRQSVRMRELWTKKTRTVESRNVLPRLLTSLQSKRVLNRVTGGYPLQKQYYHEDLFMILAKQLEGDLPQKANNTKGRGVSRCYRTSIATIGPLVSRLRQFPS